MRELFGRWFGWVGRVGALWSGGGFVLVLVLVLVRGMGVGRCG